VARLFCRLGRAHALREIGGWLAGGEGEVSRASRRPAVPPWPPPPPIGPGRATGRSSTRSWAAVSRWPKAGGRSGSRTRPSAWTPP
jgi:hypothetical protein